MYIFCDCYCCLLLSWCDQHSVTRCAPLQLIDLHSRRMCRTLCFREPFAFIKRLLLLFSLFCGVCAVIMNSTQRLTRYMAAQPIKSICDIELVTAHNSLRSFFFISFSLKCFFLFAAISSAFKSYWFFFALFYSNWIELISFVISQALPVSLFCAWNTWTVLNMIVNIKIANDNRFDEKKYILLSTDKCHLKSMIMTMTMRKKKINKKKKKLSLNHA